MKVLNRVENLLKYMPSLRDSDKKLLLAYWERQGLVLTPEQTEKFMDCTVAESITRARRALRGKYPASEKIEQHRFDRFMDYRNNQAVSWIEE